MLPIVINMAACLTKAAYLTGYFEVLTCTWRLALQSAAHTKSTNQIEHSSLIHVLQNALPPVTLTFQTQVCIDKRTAPRADCRNPLSWIAPDDPSETKSLGASCCQVDPGEELG